MNSFLFTVSHKGSISFGGRFFDGISYQDAMAGTSNRCEFVGFATGHFVYIQSESRMLDPDQIIQFTKVIRFQSS